MISCQKIQWLSLTISRVNFNPVNKTIKISTIPSVVLDTDNINDKHVTQTRPIEPTADQNCVQQLVLADIKNMPSQLTCYM